MTRSIKTLCLPLLALACLAGACERDDAAPGSKSTDKSAPSSSARNADDAQPAEHKDFVTGKDGKALTILGDQPAVGDTAPAFTAVANDMSTYTFEPGGDKVYVLSSVPSLDTPTCSVETKRFNDEAAALGEDVSILTVSMDLPFAQKRWCGAEGVEAVKTLSDSRDRAFGRAYGVQIKENGLLARAVFVVGKDGKITYRQIVSDVTREPDYAPILAAAKKAAAGKE